jgi:hypothetical protein
MECSRHGRAREMRGSGQGKKEERRKEERRVMIDRLRSLQRREQLYPA